MVAVESILSSSPERQIAAIWHATQPTSAKRSAPLTRRRIWLLLLLVAGCRKAPPPAAVDLSRTPWLDPKVQIEGLTSRESIIRGASAFNLGNIGADAADAVPQLERLAQNDPEPKVREQAAAALGKIRSALGQGGPE